MSEALTKDVPPYYIVFLIVSGFFFLYFSAIPFIFKIRGWLNPLNGNSTDIISNIILILLFCLIFGFPVLLLRDCITGNNGPVAVGKRIWKGQKLYLKLEDEDYCRKLEYFLWSKRSGLDKALSFANIKFALVNGFLAGSFAALMFNIPAILIALVVIQDKSTLICILAWSIAISLIMLVYEKFFFREGYNKLILEINRRYTIYRKSQIKKQFDDCQF